MTAPGRDKVALGIIGCGHWGPNHIRVFSEMEGASMRACCDTNAKRLERIAARYPDIRTTTDYHALLADDSIDAVVIATPTRTHFAIAADALRAGKHVLVEKPMCATAEEAKELAALVEQTGRTLMVGYVFLFNNGIRKLREIIASGGLGHLHYLDAVRTNLGPVRGDVNALYDLGTHDITIFNFFVDAEPVEVSATGRCISQEGIEDVCFATIKYANGTLGHIHVSWLNPRKIRTVTAIGERKMAHWDDVDPSDTLRVYDKGLDEPPYYDSFGEFHYLLRNADVHLPTICPGEPLAQQAQAFIDWIVTGKQTGPDVRDGWSVVAVLEAATRSMRGGGTPYPVATFDEPICTQASALRADVVPRSMDDRSRKPAATLPTAMDAP
ncbi:MAG: Gfo/Idh/MocA family oxidoreductase [Planctomycetes bacterium]|nr:Gfo/Idh/MocA family oxidoreductase [Planctomycetota bacterium]